MNTPELMEFEALPLDKTGLGDVSGILTPGVAWLVLLVSPMVMAAVAILVRVVTIAVPAIAVVATIISIGVAGTLVMALAVLLAFPDPAYLLPTAMLIAVIFVLISVRWDIPAARAIAGICLGESWLLGWHLIAGSLAWEVASHRELVQTILSAASGTALVPLAALFGAGAVLTSKSGRLPDARFVLNVDQCVLHRTLVSNQGVVVCTQDRLHNNLFFSRIHNRITIV